MTALNDHTAPAKPLGKLFKWLRVFLLIFIVSEILVAAGSLLILNTSSIMFGPEFGYSLGDGIQGIGALLLLTSFIICVIMVCIFTFKVAKNLHLIGVKSFDISPGWAVGWYFIPIANLWKPYNVTSEIWLSTHYPDQPYESTPKTFPIWWGTWIISNIVSNVSTRMSARAGIFQDYVTDLPVYKTSLVLDTVSSITGMIAAWFLIGILASIANRQDGLIQTEAFV